MKAQGSRFLDDVFGVGEGKAMDDKWKQFPLHAKSLTGVLTPEECEAIKNDALALGMSRALVRTAKGVKQQSYRTSDLVQLPRTKESEWLYERLMARGEAANAEYWHFTLNGIEEIQILRYKPWQSFKWHYDTFPGSARKLTCVVNLSPPQSYWRGRLEVRGRHGRNAITRQQGAGTWFPTYLLHRATPPWWGERWALVTWLTGPAWI
jgi:PKHD-type hydroxylase